MIVLLGSRHLYFSSLCIYRSLEMWLQARCWWAKIPLWQLSFHRGDTCGSSQSVCITKQPPRKAVTVPVMAVRDCNYWAYQLPCLLQAHKSKSCLKPYKLCSHGASPIPSLCLLLLLSWEYFPFPSLTAYLTLPSHLPFPGGLNFSSFCCLLSSYHALLYWWFVCLIKFWIFIWCLQSFF